MTALAGVPIPSLPFETREQQQQQQQPTKAGVQQWYSEAGGLQVSLPAAGKACCLKQFNFKLPVAAWQAVWNAGISSARTQGTLHVNVAYCGSRPRKRQQFLNCWSFLGFRLLGPTQRNSQLGHQTLCPRCWLMLQNTLP